MNADVVVVGAGPAGSTVAGSVASEGLKVAVLEREKEIGMSPCAGYVGCMDFPDISRGVIQSKIEKMRTFLPSGRFLDFPINGFNVDRGLFDRELASSAAACGAEFHLNSEVVGLVGEEGRYSGVRTRDGKTIGGKVIVGADGPSSVVSRLLGFSSEIAVAVQYEVSNCRVDSGVNEIYFDVDYAPGCYVWIFPTGVDSARVGLAVRPGLADRRPIDYLDGFINEHPTASERVREGLRKRLVYGVIPVGGLHKKISIDNILLVGDSAGMSDPVTGAGIGYSMLAGRIAGKAIVTAIEEDDLPILKRYGRGFRRIMGRHYLRSLEKRRLLDSLTDNKSLEQSLPRAWVTFEEYWCGD